MLQKIPDLKHKDVKGFKIREQYFDAFIIIMLVMNLALSVYCIPLIESLDTIIFCSVFMIICQLPMLILVLLNRFCFGHVFFVLSEDKLYFFNGNVIQSKRSKFTGGHVDYADLKKIEYVPPASGMFRSSGQYSRVVLSGTDFKIIINSADKRSMWLIIWKIKRLFGNGYVSENLKIDYHNPNACDEDIEYNRVGIFKEIWDAYESGELKKSFDKTVKITRIDDEENMINITVQKNNCDTDINIADDSIYMYCYEKDIDKTVSFSDVSTVDSIYKLIHEFILENTQTD